MNYTLTKLLPLFVYPLGLAIILLLAAMLLGRFKRARSAILAVAVYVLWICSTPLLADRLMSGLESEFPPLPITELPQVDAIVVLGGGVGGYNKAVGTPSLGDATERLLHGMRLLQAGRAPEILLVGGSEPGETPESILMSQLLQVLGVPAARIRLETASRNTWQNAVNAGVLLKEKSQARILLVTSALHMHRARASFEQQGITVIPVATDHRVDPAATSVLDWFPDAGALEKTTLAIKEHLGWWIYRWQGWV